MAYAIKRTYGKNMHDYLMAWDKEYGTACIGDIKQAMTFDDIDEAFAAAKRANIECYQRPGWMEFSVHPL